MMKPAIYLLICAATLMPSSSQTELMVRIDFAPSRWGVGGDLIAVDENGKRYFNDLRLTGEYRFTNVMTPADLFLYRGIGADTLYVGTAPRGITELKLTFPLKLTKNLLGHYVCPKCHRSNKTVEIVNTIAPRIRQIIVAGDTSYSSIVGRTMEEGCINGGGRGYCLRDKIRF